jgi:hypothetical protein
MGVFFLWFMVLSLRTGIHPLAFLHTIPYTTFQQPRFQLSIGLPGFKLPPDDYLCRAL